MNAISGFRLCKLPIEELLKRVDAGCDDMYKTGKIPDRHIPAQPERDFDLLLGELAMRFHNTKEFVEQCLSEDPEDETLNHILKILNNKEDPK